MAVRMAASMAVYLVACLGSQSDDKTVASKDSQTGNWDIPMVEQSAAQTVANLVGQWD